MLNTGARSCVPPVPAQQTRPSLPTATVITESVRKRADYQLVQRSACLFKADDSAPSPRLCTGGAPWPRHCLSFAWQTGGKRGGAVSRVTIRARCSTHWCAVRLSRTVSAQLVFHISLNSLCSLLEGSIFGFTYIATHQRVQTVYNAV